MVIKAKTKRRGATVHLRRKRLMRLSSHLFPRRTKSYSFTSKSVIDVDVTHFRNELTVDQKKISEDSKKASAL